jgi:hypothetical protein
MLQWVDGFETYSDLILYLQYRYATFNAPNASFVPGRAIGNALLMNGTNFITPAFANNATWTVGFAFLNVNISTNNINMPLVDIIDGITPQVTLAFNPNTRIFSGLRGSTVLCTGTFAITTGYWYYIEIKGFIDPAVGTVAIHVNTTSDSSFSGNTQSSANNYAQAIQFRGPFMSGLGGTYQLDDMYILNGAGSYNTTFLGDMKVEPITVIAAGQSAQWAVNVPNTPNFEAVQVLNDGIYIQSNTATNQDSYTTSALNRITGQIAGVSAVYWARNTDSTTHTIKSSVYRSPTTYLSSAITINNTAWQAFQNIWETDPSTTSAWQVTGVNASQFGVYLNS